MQTHSSRFVESKPHDVVDHWEDMQGPESGVVELPLHLCWAPNRTFDLSRIGHRRVLVREVLDNGTQEDQANYLNGKIIQSVWADMLLPAATRKRWQDKFPDKLSRVGKHD